MILCKVKVDGERRPPMMFDAVPRKGDLVQLPDGKHCEVVVITWKPRRSSIDIDHVVRYRPSLWMKST